MSEPVKDAMGVSVDETGDAGALYAEDIKIRGTLVANLEDLRELLRSVAIARDFFTGYSLGEALQERIDAIGVKKETIEAITDADADFLGRPTLQSRLAILKTKSDACIEQAKELLEGQVKEAEEKETEGGT